MGDEAGRAGEGAAAIQRWVEFSATGIEVLAVTIIVAVIVTATATYAFQSLTRRADLGTYEAYRQRVGRAMLLGLEILVAADVIRTVALEPTLGNVAVLGLLVLIRTFLSWTLILEIEERWPWQARPAGAGGGCRKPDLAAQEAGRPAGE
jgi:uncharacterized membrane protein